MSESLLPFGGRALHPRAHFEGAKEDPRFRTKPRIALELLVEAAVAGGIPYRAVVGDILYGEHRGFRKGLESKQIPYVLALKPFYAW
jgi:SRSO17 transposase